MRKYAGFAFVACVLAAAQLAGTQGAQSPSADAPVVLDHPLHFDVDLVQVDAVVEDRSGHRPADLKESDFEVRQDGKPQTITHFLFVPPGGPETDARGRQLQRTELRRTFLLFVDDVRIDFLDFSQMRRALLRFVNEQLQPGDLCALYRTSGGPGAARVFSADLREIRDGVERMHWLHPMPAQGDPSVFFEEFRSAIRALGALPGRKSIVLVNSGFLGPALPAAPEFAGPTFTPEVLTRTIRSYAVHDRQQRPHRRFARQCGRNPIRRASR
jgi:VWFA-related protein